MPSLLTSQRPESHINSTSPLAAQIRWSPSFYPPIGVIHTAMWSPVRLSGKSPAQRQSLPYIQVRRPELTTRRSLISFPFAFEEFM